MARRYGRESCQWELFGEDEEDRPAKPRRYGVTEMRGPVHSLSSPHALQVMLEHVSQFVDGLKFSGSACSLMSKTLIKEITDLAHQHDIYVTAAEDFLHKGSSAFKGYVEECKDLGFDAVELNMASLKLPEESLLRCIHLIKRGGLRAKPLFSVKFDTADVPDSDSRAFGAYKPPSVMENSEIVEDINLLLRMAERCLEAGADMIMVDADDVCKYPSILRSDIIAKIVGRLGLEKTMFEASDARTSEWFIEHYGPRVNLYVDQSEVVNLECLRSGSIGRSLASIHDSPFFRL